MFHLGYLVSVDLIISCSVQVVVNDGEYIITVMMLDALIDFEINQL